MGGPESSCFDGIGLGSLRVDAAHLQEQHRRDSSLEKPRAPETAISEAHEIERGRFGLTTIRSSPRHPAGCQARTAVLATRRLCPEGITVMVML
jgi:hypothetical protein